MVADLAEIGFSGTAGTHGIGSWVAYWGPNNSSNIPPKWQGVQGINDEMVVGVGMIIQMRCNPGLL